MGFDPVAASVSKAAALNVLKRFDEALAACEQAFQAGTQDMNAAYYDNKGRALYGLARYEEALEAFEQAIRQVIIEISMVLKPIRSGNSSAPQKQ